MALHHVNWHTVHALPVFEQPEYDAMIRACIREILRAKRILAVAWDIMPTHVHMVVEDFPDFPRWRIVQQVKGSSAHSFFQTFPNLRNDLLGGHLWSKGYFATLINTHDQCCATITYVRNNRFHAGLEPPVPLTFIERG